MIHLQDMEEEKYGIDIDNAHVRAKVLIPGRVLLELY